MKVSPTMPDCPQCERYFIGRKCKCGWKPEGHDVKSVTRTCSNCERERVTEQAGNPDTYECKHCKAISAWFCWRCGNRSHGVATVMTNGERLCGTCRSEAMTKRSAAEYEYCTEPGCNKTAAQHIAEFRAIVSRWEASGKITSKR